MAIKFKVNKEKCIGAALCISACTKGAEWGEDGKARIKNSEELEKCGGKNLCPYGAIEEVKGKR